MAISQLNESKAADVIGELDKSPKISMGKIEP